MMIKISSKAFNYTESVRDGKFRKYFGQRELCFPKNVCACTISEKDSIRNCPQFSLSQNSAKYIFPRS